MIDVERVSEELKQFSQFQQLADRLAEQLAKRLAQYLHGDLEKWRQALDALPDIKPSSLELNSPAIKIGAADDIDEATRQNIIQQLRKIHPWRKGPFDLFGIHIDTEWRSDWKWDRIKPHLQPLKDRLVLDVGCGNGYYGWRMLGEGAKYVIGIDPTQSYITQFQVMQKYIQASNIQVLPLAMEDMPQNMQTFDTVFSMGVLYHRKSPIDHLLELRDSLRQSGELVLETLIIEGDERSVMMPQRRYAQMRNVWFIPSVEALKLWLKRSGFANIRCVDITKTTVEEQRNTPWMTYQSLADFLDPHNPDLTKEGLPAPVRATLIAEKP
ncbi:MAG: tRNA 5-methoxyuridine(34)/uridine 5-oxyacetic acid(34) synthase CmoB [Gammaproteobacteria bacterium]|jgi:tRNA (mo5U34)-methyltransferase|nr:tRNA 5-methoxyuridine(34)/uridine 5-oxyacetic acid(34) synthase CmoB [Gammaproteobacteria bacterium]